MFSYKHKTNWLYMAYLWHVRGIFAVGTYMVIVWKKVAVLWCFWLACAVMWDLHVDCFIWSHEPKHYVVFNFNHLDPRNAMVPLMIMLVSCNASGSTSGVTWPKKSCCTSFHCLGLWKALMQLTTALASCGTTIDSNGISDQKSHVTPYFDCHWPKECNYAIDDTIGINMTVIPTPVASHDQNHHVAHSYIACCLNLRNVVVPLMMQ